MKIRIASVYGKTAVYPADENSETLAAIAGTKTLSPRTLRLAEKLGFVATPMDGNEATLLAAYKAGE